MKCLCCGNEMTRYEIEQYNKMTDEEVVNILKEHKDNCEWADNLKKYKELIKKDAKENDFLGLSEQIIYLKMKVSVLYDILRENGLTNDEEFKNRLIYKTRKALDFKARERLIKEMDEDYTNKKF